MPIWRGLGNSMSFAIRAGELGVPIFKTTLAGAVIAYANRLMATAKQLLVLVLNQIVFQLEVVVGCLFEIILKHHSVKSIPSSTLDFA
ncbi:hypothetical protein ACF3NG_09520 [Aerococcaceae bacterium WGS1372]